MFGIGGTELLVILFLAAIVLGESLPLLSLLGGGMILAAVILLTQAELRNAGVAGVEAKKV